MSFCHFLSCVLLSRPETSLLCPQQLTWPLLAVAFLTSFGSSMLYGYNLAVVNSPALVTHRHSITHTSRAKHVQKRSRFPNQKDINGFKRRIAFNTGLCSVQEKRGRERCFFKFYKHDWQSLRKITRFNETYLLHWISCADWKMSLWRSIDGKIYRDESSVWFYQTLAEAASELTKSSTVKSFSFWYAFYKVRSNLAVFLSVKWFFFFWVFRSVSPKRVYFRGIDSGPATRAITCQTD